MTSKVSSKVTSMQFDSALNQYYKLKKRYDLSIQKAVAKIRSDEDLTTKEKEEKFSEIKKRCVKCGKTGGTIFRQEGTNLYANCGNDTPCSLNIHLQRAKYMPIDDAISELSIDINNRKAEIINTKLDFLFGFVSESETVARFNDLKSDLVNIVKKHQKMNEKYISIVQDLPNRDEILKLNSILEATIRGFKNLITQFDETGEIQYIKDAGQLYVNEIVKISDKLQSLKYTEQYVYLDPDNNNNLVQKTYKSSELEVVVPGTENKIISFSI